MRDRKMGRYTRSLLDGGKARRREQGSGKSPAFVSPRTRLLGECMNAMLTSRGAQNDCVWKRVRCFDLEEAIQEDGFGVTILYLGAVAP